MRRIAPLLLAVFQISVVISSAADGDDFVVSDKFDVYPAIKPGLVKHPVMATLDDRGRLFVAENAGLNLNKEELLKQRPNSVRLLVDSDRDGVYDRATTFADGLTFPQGALWIYDSLYVMSPPSLWRFHDSDGDGVAEEREELATGFDFTGNAADVHGPFLHPNGRIFWCHGRKGYAIPDPDTGDIFLSGKGARLWSSTLSGSEVEAFAGGGMDNPVEVDFTDRGEIIGTVNLFYGRPRGDTFTHWIYGGVYPRHDQEQAIEDLPQTGPLLTEAHNFGHVAVSGMCRYRSGVLDASWKDQWLVTHFNTAEVTITRLARDGATFSSTGTDSVLKVRKPDAHLTDVLEDHNGDLLLIDTGGWFRIGCPTSHVAKPEVAGNIYRVAPKGRTYKSPSYPDWERLDAETVSRFLDSEEFWLAERAGLELAGRGDPAIPELRRVLLSGASSVDARRNAVWTLAKLQFSETTDLVYEALVDPDPSVRQAACQALGTTRTWQSVAANQPAERGIELERNRTISGALAKIVRGDDAPVAREAAFALGRMAERRAIGAILGRLGRVGDDRFLEHSLIYALIDIDDPEAVRVGLTSENAATVSAVLRALDAMPSADLEVLDVLPHLDAEEVSLRTSAAGISIRHSEWDAALANRFFEWSDDLTPSRSDAITEVAPAFSSSPPMQDFFGSLVTSSESGKMIFGLRLLAEADSIDLLSEWEPVLKNALRGDLGNEARELALQILSKSNASDFTDELNAIFEDSSNPILVRIRAAQAIADANAVLPEMAFELIASIVAGEKDSAVRSEAMGILKSTRLSGAQRIRLAELADQFTPVELPVLMQVFRNLPDENQAAALAPALARSPSFASLDLARIEQIFRPYAEIYSKHLSEKVAEAEQEKREQAGRINELVSASQNADPLAGKTVFESGAGSCLVCHRIGDSGGRIGPDLSTIGRIRTSRDLFESILYPNESIARDFNTHGVRRKGDRPPIVGLIESQSSDAVTIVDPTGQRFTIPRNEIDLLTEVPLSLMPQGLDQTMSTQELQDLVAYLMSRK